MPPIFLGVPIGGKFVKRAETAVQELREPLQIFPGYSPQQLSRIGRDRAAGQDWVYGSTMYFAELDEQSTRDDTVKFHYCVDKQDHWVFWRVRFDESFDLLTKFEFVFPELPLYKHVFSQWDRWIDENGVFPVKEATDTWLREEEQRLRERGNIEGYSRI